MPRRKGKNGAPQTNETPAQKYARAVSDSQASVRNLIKDNGGLPSDADHATSTSQADTEGAIDDTGSAERNEAEAGPSSRPASRADATKEDAGNGIAGNHSNDHERSRDGDEDDEDEDDEPTLRYRRLTSKSITEIFARDSCSAIAVSSKYLVLGTHSGGVVVLARAGTVVRDKGKGKEVEKLDDASIHEDDEGSIVVKRYRPHTASVLDIVIDEESQYIGTASMDGKVIVLQVATSDAQQFNLGRPLRCMAFEPLYAGKSTKQFVSGGMAGSLILHEKGWLGPKDVTLHTGEGPIGAVAWRRNYIAWANDRGTRIYDTHLHQRVAFIPRPADSPRPDLFPCCLYWQSDTTLLTGWADHVKIIKYRDRRRHRHQPPDEGGGSDTASITSTNPLATMGNLVPGFGTSTHSAETKQPAFEVTQVLQLDCMISGLVPFLPTEYFEKPPPPSTPSKNSLKRKHDTYAKTKQLLILTYTSTESFDNEATADISEQKRKPSAPPELRILNTASGEEMSSDVLSLKGFERFQCGDYGIVGAFAAVSPEVGGGRHEDSFFVVSPSDVVLIKKRDVADHIAWLCEKSRYEEALRVVETQRSQGLLPSSKNGHKSKVDVAEIGQKYLTYLIQKGEFDKAAQNFRKLLGMDVTAWDAWVETFIQEGKIDIVVPFVPTHDPQLEKGVYLKILQHFLHTDPNTLLQTIKTWPKQIYDFQAVVDLTKDQLDDDPRSPKAPKLMECLIELHQTNKQPGKALQYYLRLKKAGAFDLIRQYNLFPDVQDQVLLLVEFDQDMLRRQKERSTNKTAPDFSKHGQSIDMLVDHTQSIPITRVVEQLKVNRYYLYMYLDALWTKDPPTSFEYSNLLVDLLAEFEHARLINFLRASTAYSLQKAFDICERRDYVPEMVFLLGRMGNNKKALTLIIERLGEVQKAIDFAKEQNDQELWDDLMKYSENKPTFIRGLLENVGPEIDPIRLIKRIKNGMEIPGLKPALIKILTDFNIQISLIEGCRTILDSDCRQLMSDLYDGRTMAFLAAKDRTPCQKCGKPAFAPAQPSTSTIVSATTAEATSILFLCRHIYHISCVLPDADLPSRPQHLVNSAYASGSSDNISDTILFSLALRSRNRVSCPQCSSSKQQLGS